MTKEQLIKFPFLDLGVFLSLVEYVQFEVVQLLLPLGKLVL